MENAWNSRRATDQIKTVLLDQFEGFWKLDTGLERTQLTEVERAARAPHTVIVSGLRRVGKTTLLAQMAHKLGRETFYYVNFEDERFLGFQSNDIDYLYQTLVETFSERKIFILDQVPTIPGWEQFVRRFMDLGFKFYLAGSNVSMLSWELGTHLTGRYVLIELFPFSFGEFIQFRNEAFPDLRRLTTLEKIRLKNLLAAYLRSGGLPEALKYPELPLLRELYEAILSHDIAARHHLEKVAALRELAFYLLSHPAGLSSPDQLKRQSHLGSVKTIQNDLSYLENSWLVFALDIYAPSLKRQPFRQKKIYCIDTGLATAVGFSPEPRKLLENLVFLALRRQTKDLSACLLPGGFESGFYLPKRGHLIQISTDWGSPATRARGLQALSAALKMVRVENALILSDANQKSFELGGLQVEVRSIAEWLASQ